METNRRALLQGFTGAALLAPYLALEKAMAAEPAKAPHGTSPDHMAGMAEMEKVLGPGLYGQEKVALLIYPKFTALDLVGPHYFFACMFGAKVHLVTTEKDLSPVASDLGLAISPTVTMADAPKDLDVLFIPGGTEGTLGVMGRADTMDWVKDRASRAKHITSVCTGSMVLAKAGLLKGKRATSHWVTRDVLTDFGAIPVNERVVKDGNILTGAGVSSGLDFAIALVEMLRGKPYAEGLMLQAEYAPEPPFKGGTLATTTPDVAKMMDDMFKPVGAMFKAMAAG
ncbi:DJ-1/PfpI family protein [Sphingorhabdus contaminans]|uniref:DJ-1/PfpI family protein n=1 Tax=Sphingorhabdus contaminans TaxID=1343899 RepID=UPI003D287983